jgi:HSP20 family molecular chaperone IbpA
MVRTLLPRVWRPLGLLGPQWDPAFESFFGGDPFSDVFDVLAAPSEREGFLGVDVWETPTALHVEADLPGVVASDVDVQVQAAELTLKVDRRSDALEGERWLRRERRAGSYARTLSLPAEVDPNAVEAELSDGILRLRLPKAERAKPRAIPIKTNS